MGKMSNLDINEIALVRKSRGKTPVNPDAVVEIVKAQDSTEDVTESLVTRITKAVLPFLSSGSDAGAQTPAPADTALPTAVAKATGSYEELRHRVCDAVCKAFGDDCYVEATYPESAVVCCYDSEYNATHYRVPYTADEGGAVTLGHREEVSAVTTYEPVAKAADLLADLAQLERVSKAQDLGRAGESIAERAHGLLGNASGQMRQYVELLRETASGTAPTADQTTNTTAAVSKAGTETETEQETTDVTIDEIKKAVAEQMTEELTALSTTLRDEIKKAREDDTTARDAAITSAVDTAVAPLATVVKAMEERGIEEGRKTPAPVAKAHVTPDSGVVPTNTEAPVVGGQDFRSALRSLLHVSEDAASV